MVGRIVATAVILAFLALDLLLPSTSLGRRGTEDAVRSDVAGAFAETGVRLPDFALVDLDGNRLRTADFRGHRTVLTFERSLDW